MKTHSILSYLLSCIFSSLASLLCKCTYMYKCMCVYVGYVFVCVHLCVDNFNIDLFPDELIYLTVSVYSGDCISRLKNHI